MPSAGSYADVLRALGRYLDENGAEHVEITEHESFLAVSWQDANGEPGRRAYTEVDLTRLRDEAQRLRSGQEGTATPGELSELMRTMGQDLDAMGFASNRIAADPDSFTVSGIADRHYHVLRFWKYELRDTSAERRANRRAAGAPPPPKPVAATEKPTPRWQFWRR